MGSLKLSRWERGSGASPGGTLGSSSSGGAAEVGAHLVLQQQAQQCETWEETSQKWLHCLTDTALSAPGCDKRRWGKATGLQRAAAAAAPRKWHRYRCHAAPRGPASASINHGEEGLSLLLLLLSLLQHHWGKGGDEDPGPWAHLGTTPPAVAAASCPAGPGAAEMLKVLGQHQGILVRSKAGSITKTPPCGEEKFLRWSRSLGAGSGLSSRCLRAARLCYTHGAEPLRG